MAVAGLQVANTLKAFIEMEALPGTGLDAAGFWPAYAGLLAVYAPRNAVLLQLRDALQARIAARRTTRRPIPGSCARSATSSRSPRRSASARRTSMPRSPASPGRSSSCR